jgi:hypothetical protein
MSNCREMNATAKRLNVREVLGTRTVFSLHEGLEVASIETTTCLASQGKAEWIRRFCGTVAAGSWGKGDRFGTLGASAKGRA